MLKTTNNTNKYVNHAFYLRLIWKILHLAGNFDADAVCDKYEVCVLRLYQELTVLKSELLDPLQKLRKSLRFL